jgi:hypothetical protein
VNIQILTNQAYIFRSVSSYLLILRRDAELNTSTLVVTVVEATFRYFWTRREFLISSCNVLVPRDRYKGRGGKLGVVLDV